MTTPITLHDRDEAVQDRDLTQEIASDQSTIEELMTAIKKLTEELSKTDWSNQNFRKALAGNS